eukprot:TRINITY_DN4372_c0_g2_i1.p1 TRINITY_DN4372_c0_g2~~TRINITY_DN4372_c0_g2_i1.p1  ORF type:complete len:596 (-),score=179.83 TRINITY_DN4372_c0_g2_i1:288-1940(-)
MCLVLASNLRLVSGFCARSMLGASSVGSNRHVAASRQRHTLKMGAVASTGGKRKRGKANPEMDAVLEKYEPVIGIEIHVQLATESKAYCRCSTTYSPLTPNTNICPVCMGEPGSLPVPNDKVVEIAAKAGMALGCSIAQETKWDRKNYFYPDTPKNYQITQYDRPIGEHGRILLPNGREVGVTRIHMEEDSAKMNHQGAGTSLAGSTHSLIDFNRAGIPLAEIVSEPDMRSGLDAAEYGKELQRILRYIGASDGNMAEGSLRLDVNVSLRPKGSSELRTKVELKNLNSFRAVQESTDYEIIRQGKCYETGETIRQETRLWDEKEKVTKIMRVKEGESDYRYFPEPDIPPLRLPRAVIDGWRAELCELPAEKRARYRTEYKLSEADAETITDDQTVAAYFEAAIAAGADPSEAAKWILGDIAAYVNKAAVAIADIGLTPPLLAEMVTLIQGGRITGKIAKELLPELLEGGCERGVAALVKERGMEVITDVTVIEGFVREVMEKNADKVEQYRGGKAQLAGFFVGQSMALSGSRADPGTLQRVVKAMLDGTQ